MHLEYLLYANEMFLVSEILLRICPYFVMKIDGIVLSQFMTICIINCWNIEY